MSPIRKSKTIAPRISQETIHGNVAGPMVTSAKTKFASPSEIGVKLSAIQFSTPAKIPPPSAARMWVEPGGSAAAAVLCRYMVR